MMGAETRKSCLIACLGTSEPRVQAGGEWLKLKHLEDDTPWPELHGEPGLYRACSTILARTANPKVWYPITELASDSAGMPSEVFLICTDDPGHRKGEAFDGRAQRDDTEPSGRLLQREWKVSAKHRDQEVHIHPLPEDPDSLVEARRAVKKLLDAIGPEGFQTVYFCQSAGIPAVNAELIRQLLKRARAKPGMMLKLFQIRHPEEKFLKKGEWAAGNDTEALKKLIEPVSQERMMADYLLDVVPELLESHAYKAAEVVLGNPSGYPKFLLDDLRKAGAYWSLDLKNAGLYVEDPFLRQMHRARLGWYVTQALAQSGVNDVRQTVEWCGNTIGITQDLLRMYALELEHLAEIDKVQILLDGEATCHGKPVLPAVVKKYLEKETSKVRVSDLLHACKQGVGPRYAEVSAGIDAMGGVDCGKVRHARNAITHRNFAATELTDPSNKLLGADWKPAITASLVEIEKAQETLFRLKQGRPPALNGLDELHRNIVKELTKMAEN